MGSRRDDLADLGRDFDRMAPQLQTLTDCLRRLLHDVSHEIRTPLARLQAAIGLARQHPEKVEQSLDRIERESVRINQGRRVPESKLHSIFTPFSRGIRTRGKEEGHCLGLAIAKRIVEAHHGSIRAMNLLGDQFRFEIRLPLIGTSEK